MKHTPGPWKVTTCMDYWVEPVNSDPAKQFVGIAHCGDINWPDYEKMQPEWEANARLIAASPDLLEALKELHAMYAHTWDRVDGALVMIDRGVTRFEKAHEAASAAIARAEGK